MFDINLITMYFYRQSLSLSLYLRTCVKQMVVLCNLLQIFRQNNITYIRFALANEQLAWFDINLQPIHLPNPLINLTRNQITMIQIIKKISNHQEWGMGRLDPIHS